MNQDLIDRYQNGGDIYAAIAAKYGAGTADAAASAALTGDETQINKVLAGPLLNTSTASIFLNQIETDPLGAPLASLENLTKNSLLDFLKSPSVLLVLAGIAFFMLGGAEVLKEQVAKLKQAKLKQL
jgi:hypothetical protein